MISAAPFEKDMSKKNEAGQKQKGMHTALATLGVSAQTSWNGCAKIDTLLHPSTVDAGSVLGCTECRLPRTPYLTV